MMSLENGSPTEKDPHSLTDIPRVSFLEEEQVGGGRRVPSPMPTLTPTRLRTAVKATARDVGLVRSAQARRSGLLDHEAPTSHAEEDDPFTAAPKTPTSSLGNSVLCASLLFDGYATGEGISFYGRAGSPTSDNAVTAENVASRHDDESAVSKGHPLAKPSVAVGQNGLSMVPPRTLISRSGSHQPHSNGSTCETTLTTYRTPSGRPASLPPPDVPEPVVVSPFFDEDTPRPAPGVLPTVPFSTGYEVQTDEGSGEGDIVTNNPPARPETPSPAERVSKRTAASSTNRGAEQPAMVGRPSGVVVELLDDAFQRIDDEFHEVSGKVGMPFHQVVARYTKQFSRMNTANLWNLYQKYSMANKDTELARVPEADVNATPSARLARCYTLFRAEYPDTWHEILTAFEEVDAMEEHTVSQRGLVFQKLAKNFKHSFSAMAKAHAFEGVFVMAGSVVNQDAGLGLAFATPGSQDFFPDRCRADNNEILGHFKAHIYNKVSLNHINLAFEGEEGSTTKKEVQSPHDEVEAVRNDGRDEQDDHGKARVAFISALLKVGCKWAAGRMFPWKGLPRKLAKSGVICYNYPDSVLFPGEDCPSRSKAKGIGDLTLPECSTLISALADVSKDRLHFERVSPDVKIDLQQFRIPVIYGAAPEHDSARSHAKRVYANLTTDYKGPARKKNPAATRIKKKGKARLNDPDVISINDSDDSAIRVTLTKRKNHSPSAGGVVDLTETADQVDGHHEQMEAVITRPVRKATKRKLEIENLEVLSTPSGSDYQPDDAVDLPQDAEKDGDEGSVDVEEHNIPSRKRRRTVAASARPSKKSLVSKGKRKASNVVPRPTKRVRVMSASHHSDSSDLSDSNGGPSKDNALQERPVTPSDSIPGPSRGKASQVRLATQSAVVAQGSIVAVAPMQDHEATNATIAGQSSGAVSVNVSPPPRSITTAPVAQERLPSDVANGSPPQEIIRPAVQPTPSVTDPLPPTIAPPIQPRRPKPRLVSKSNPSRNNIDDGEDPFSMRKRQVSTTGAPLDVVDAGVSQLQAAEEGRAGVPATVVAPAPLTARDPIVTPAAIVAPAPVAAGTSISTLSIPALVAPVTIVPNDTVAPVADSASIVSERVVFPRLPVPAPPFKNDTCAPLQEGPGDPVRTSTNEGVPPGFGDQMPIMGGGWYPPLHAYHGSYPPFPGPYAQWPPYAELDRARTRNSMAPPTHAMGGYPMNMPPFDTSGFYYRGQPTFMGTQQSHNSFLDARAHAGMSHSSTSGPDVSAAPAPGCDTSKEEGTHR